MGNRALLCAFILMVSFAAMPVYAAVGDRFTSDGLNYKVLTENGNTGTVEVGNNQRYVGRNLVIPATVMRGAVTYDVVSVGNNAFDSCTGLTGTLTIPASVTSIGEAAFAGTGIAGTLTIPSSVISIGESAFAICYGITALDLPASGLQTIGAYAFTGTAIAGTLTIPSSVTFIGETAFYECTEITALALPASGSLAIGPNAFASTGIAGTLTVPSSVTSIEEAAFANCGEITTLYWRTSLDLPEATFFGCINLNAIYITSAATAPSVGSNVFDWVPATGTLYFPTGATGYTRDAFGLQSGWTVQTINFPALALAANPPSPQSYHGSVRLTATLTGADNNVGKPIVFTVNGAVYGSTLNTAAGGVATCTVSGLTVGTHDFGVSFAGDADVNAPATDIIAGYTVVKANAVVSLAPAPIRLLTPEPRKRLYLTSGRRAERL